MFTNRSWEPLLVLIIFSYIGEWTQNLMLALQMFYHWTFILKLALTQLAGLAWNSLCSPGRPGFCCPVASPSQVAFSIRSGSPSLSPELRLEQRGLTFGGETACQAVPGEDFWESISGTGSGHVLRVKAIDLSIVESHHSSMTDSAAPSSSIKPVPRGSDKRWQVKMHKQKEGILVSFWLILYRQGGHKWLDLGGSGKHSMH